MKPQRSFIAERQLAQHCPELLRARAPTGGVAPALGRLTAVGAPLARVLAKSLASLGGEEAPTVTFASPRISSIDELADGIGPLAANSLLSAEGQTGARASPFLASIEARVVLRLLDRAFGGQGTADAKLPRELPLSAELMIARLETIVSAAVTQALPGGPAIRALRRDSNLGRLAPFDPSAPLTVIVLTVQQTGEKPWDLTLGFPAPTLEALFGKGGPGSPGDAADASAERLCDMPLTLSARLVDMKLPLALISAMRPGDVLPVAVARSIPLSIGGKIIAHGAIGAMEDRVALQLTQAFA